MGHVVTLFYEEGSVDQVYIQLKRDCRKAWGPSMYDPLSAAELLRKVTV